MKKKLTAMQHLTLAFICLVASTIFICIIAIISSTNSSNEDKGVKNGKRFEDDFVVIEKYDRGEKILLELETGCKYISKNRSMAPKVKDKEFDCDIKYVEQYLNGY